MNVLLSISFLVLACVGTVRGVCDVTFKVFNANSNKYYETINSIDPNKPMRTIDSGYRRCFDLSIQAVIGANCGAVKGPVRIMLRQNTTVVHAITERVAPYFLYGNDATTGDIYGQALEGVYAVRARVDGVWTPYHYYELPMCCKSCQ